MIRIVLYIEQSSNLVIIMPYPNTADSVEAQPPLTIGIVACSAEGAALCYRTICARAPAVLGRHAHPEIVLHGISLAAYVAALEAGDLAGVADIMLRSADKLAAMGADFLICPDNTIHAAMPLVAERSPLPWLHIAEVAAAEAQSRDIRTAGLLGTRWLVDSDVYPDALSPLGINVLRPEPEERDEVDRIIMDELVNDIHISNSTYYLANLINHMKQRDCEAVILGCTELPLAIGDHNSALPVLDSTRLLADAALARSVSTG